MPKRTFLKKSERIQTILSPDEFKLQQEKERRELDEEIDKLIHPEWKEQKKIEEFFPKDADYWSKYNRAKSSEKQMFYFLLDELLNQIKEPEAEKNGRPPIPLRDLLFCACIKTYNNFSARRISSDLKHCERMGFVKRVPHYNSLINFFNEEMTEEILRYVLVLSAIPLASLETDFSADSSGFGSYQYERWMRVRFGGDTTKRGWRNYLKAHISVGTRTNVCTALKVTSGNFNDGRQFEYLALQTGANFKVERYSADKGYSSKRNMQIVRALDALPFIAFKENSTGKTDSPTWNAMYNFMKEHPEQFKHFYHRRSNVESTFAMVKLKFGEFLRFKNFQAQKSEVTLKFICHNITCLVEHIFLNDIKVDFSQHNIKIVSQ